MADTKLTRETYDRLSQELEQLKTEGRVNIARTIEAARELGDLSENADYHAAKDEQGRMEGRIRQLEAMLKDAEIVEAPEGGAPADGGVSIGTIVTLDFGDGPERYLLGSIEERPDGVDGVISPDSHLGKQLLEGKDVVTTPNGAEVKVLGTGA